MHRGLVMYCGLVVYCGLGVYRGLGVCGSLRLVECDDIQTHTRYTACAYACARVCTECSVYARTYIYTNQPHSYGMMFVLYKHTAQKYTHRDVKINSQTIVSRAAQGCTNRTIARNVTAIWDGVAMSVWRNCHPGNYDITGTNTVVYHGNVVRNVICTHKDPSRCCYRSAIFLKKETALSQRLALLKRFCARLRFVRISKKKRDIYIYKFPPHLIPRARMPCGGDARVPPGRGGGVGADDGTGFVQCDSDTKQ